MNETMSPRRGSVDGVRSATDGIHDLCERRLLPQPVRDRLCPVSPAAPTMARELK